VPRPAGNPPPVETIRIGVADAHGVAPGSLSVRTDFPVGGRAPGAELADLARDAGEDVVEIPLDPPLAALGEYHVYARVADLQGNVTRVDRRFFVGNPPAPPPSEGCPATPASACAPARASGFAVRAGRLRRLDWKWTGATPLASADLGDPMTGGTAYRLCAYDGAGTLLSDLPVPAGRRCGKRPCWRRLRAGGFRYDDAHAAAAGVARVLLRPGATGRIRVGARGARLAAPPLPIAAPDGVTVQLRRTDDAARCWDAKLGASRRNGPRRFGANAHLE
jgi:hypothetical protein